MDLQNTFYILGIIFMSLMLILIVTILATVLIIKSKITHILNAIEKRINIISSVLDKVGTTGAKAVDKVLNKK